MTAMLPGWLRARLDALKLRLIARLGDRIDARWRKRARENFYDPIRELQMFGDLLEPIPNEPGRPGAVEKVQDSS